MAFSYLGTCLVQYSDFDSAGGDEAQYSNLSLLPNPVCTILGLLVHLRIPVAIEDDHGIRGLQIDAHTSRARRKQEDEVLRAVFLKKAHLLSTVIDTDLP